MVVLGLSLAGWSYFEMRPVPPTQEPWVEAEVYLPSAPMDSAEDHSELVEEPIDLYPIRPAIGDKIGTITLPSLDLSWPIYEGTDEEQLSQGVGHYRRSVLPGYRDNSVLSGHRTTVFGRLGELEQGDLIHVATSAGRFTYQVESFRIVPRTDRSVIVPTPTAILTLTTCHPFYSLTKTTDAFIVTAELIDFQLTGD
jgi:sortase A